MKKILTLFGFVVLVFSFCARETQAQLNAGAGIAFGSEIEQVGLQGDIHYRLPAMPAVRVGGGLIYYFPKDNHNFLEANLNGNYIFYEEFMFKSYGLAGLNYARSSISDTNISDSAFGLNLGIGGEYDFGPLLGFGELKYVVSDFDQAVFSIGVRFGF